MSTSGHRCAVAGAWLGNRVPDEFDAGVISRFDGLGDDVWIDA